MKKAVPLLIFCVAALLGIGLVMLYSAGISNELKAARYFPTQAKALGIGLVAALLMAYIDYRVWKKLAWPALGAVLIALVCVMFTKPVNGAHRWFTYGSFHFQPSEVAKLVVIIVTAACLEKRWEKIDKFKQGFLPVLLVVAPVIGLIFIEPDRGTTIQLAAVWAVMMLVGGARFSHMVLIGMLGVALLGASMMRDTVRRDRLKSWLNPEATKDSVGYQGQQGRLALGAGGLTGVGLGNGMAKLGYVPENHTDFILSVIGEELGFVGTVSVLFLFVTFISCGLVITLNAEDRFGMLLALGITFLLGLQVFVNIGVVTGVLPNKGLALPFISYGGSSLLATLTEVGLLLSVALRALFAAKPEADEAEGEFLAVPVRP